MYVYICSVNLYIQVFGCRADDTKTKQLSMALNHLPLIGVKHWQEPAGWDRAGDPAPCRPDVTNVPARLALLPMVKRSPSLSCACLGKPCQVASQSRVGCNVFWHQAFPANREPVPLWTPWARL